MLTGIDCSAKIPEKQLTYGYLSDLVAAIGHFYNEIHLFIQCGQFQNDHRKL